MTTIIQSPKSSVKSSSSSPTMKHENDSHCRRDANCSCKICLDSINATLDLMPISAQRSTLTTNTKLSSSKSKPLSSPPQTPLFFDNPSTISTPMSLTSRLMLSPIVNSTQRNGLKLHIKKNKEQLGSGLMFMKCVFVSCLVLVLVSRFGFLFLSNKMLETKLSPEIVRNLSDKSLELGVYDVKERLVFLSNELQNLVPEAAFVNPIWEIVQDGLILRSRCILYKSRNEQVSIWGWPLRTAGLVKTEFHSRSFTILSGRVSEWSNGELNCVIRTANASWEQGKWSDLAWQLDENTWILEYKRSFVFENTRPFWSAMEFLKFKMMIAFQQMELWNVSNGNGNHMAPT
uniref:uncharacterized protein LOC122596499 n=1 Tax=Erigeron canadensis TaxID=72917 RepID=UPI001CB8E4AF|nr:uncharacterized protein LOC122596499 [Erigeron canadensis]